MTEHNEGKFLKETDLHALIDPTPPGNATINGTDINHHFEFEYDNNTETFSLNGAPFVPNITVPILLQILSNVSAADKVLPPSSVYKLPRNKSVSISMPGGLFDGPVFVLLFPRVFRHSLNFSFITASISLTRRKL